MLQDINEMNECSEENPSKRHQTLKRTCPGQACMVISSNFQRLVACVPSIIAGSIFDQ